MKTEGIQKAKILKALLELNKVSKILDSFLPVFLDKTIPKNDRVWLHGAFNLGGTVSGRLSSNNPNMQNLPSTGSIYAKPVKKCFSASAGWLLIGADFNALEARIGALITKDPAKLGVYLHGYDSHSFNAYGYWPDKMPDIVNEFNKATTEKERVEIINSIQNKYKSIRQASKTITFAAQYQGTYKTFMNSGGFSEEEAKTIEANYHKLYAASTEWLTSLLNRASKAGYITGAFGLKVRTPILAQVLYGKKMPYEAQAEARTAGNAAQQSFGLLNNRAQNEFLARVAASEYRLDIHPIAAIHDATYWLVRRNPEVVKFVNDNLIECMEWNDDPAIYHPQVGLGGELEIFYPTWADSIGIKNKASLEDIIEILDKL
jgi:DNA polymerase-1